MHTYQTIQVYIKFNLLTFRRYIAKSSEQYIYTIYILSIYIIDNNYLDILCNLQHKKKRKLLLALKSYF